MNRFFTFLIVLFFTTIIAAQSSQKASINKKEFLQLYIDKKGKIIENNQEISFKTLKNKLLVLKQKNGVVHLAHFKTSKKSVIREHTKVMDLISNYKISIRPFTDKNFLKEIIW